MKLELFPTRESILKSIQLNHNDELLILRSMFNYIEDQSLQLTISREHARIFWDGANCKIEDKSSRGTFINGNLVGNGNIASISDGDILTLNDNPKLGFVASLTDPFGSVEDLQTPKDEVPKQVKPPRSTQLAHDDGLFLDPPGTPFIGKEFVQYLPDLYHTSFMRQFLSVFESIKFPIDWYIDHFDFYLDPLTTPSSFLPWLENFWGFKLDKSWTEEQRRIYLSEAHTIIPMRGTEWALYRILNIYLVRNGKQTSECTIEYNNDANEVVVIIKLDEKQNEQFIARQGIESIIDFFKPAYLAHKIILG